MNETNILDFELGPENEIKLVKQFKSFQRQYLAVYLLVMGKIIDLGTQKKVLKLTNMFKVLIGFKDLIYTSYTTRMVLI
jgi:hypothetical protein